MVEMLIFDCNEYGSLQSRLRLYILGLFTGDAVLGDSAKEVDVEAPRSDVRLWKGFMNYFTIPSLPVSRFIIFDLEVLRDAVCSVGIVAVSDNEKST